MRIFICSVSVFCILCIAVTLDSVTVCRRTDELIEYTENLPAESMEAQTDRLIDLWQEYKTFYGLTVNHADMDKIEAAIYALHYADNTDSYEAARSVLLILLRDLREFSSVSWERII